MKAIALNFSIVREIQYRRGEYVQLSRLGGILFEQDKVSEANSQYELFLSDCKDLRDSDSVAQAQASLATVALEQGRFAEGITLASQAADKYKDDQSADLEASTYALQSRLLLGLGRVREAHSASSRSTALAGTTGSRSPKYEATLATSYVKVRTDRATDAAQHLKAMKRPT
jgi:tetratricopeptide (TPR) repeat protein